MDKLKLAHDYALKLMGRSSITIDEVVRLSFDLADAMQAEAEERINNGRPEALCEVDWSQAPKEYPTTGWYIFKGVAHWISDDFPCGPAPTFGFTGSHIVERPNGF